MKARPTNDLTAIRLHAHQTEKIVFAKSALEEISAEKKPPHKIERKEQTESESIGAARWTQVPESRGQHASRGETKAPQAPINLF